MKNNIKFSVIIPSYNQGEYLEETIQSVLNQKYKNFDIYILDGGSTDNSVDVIKKYEDKIKYWHSKKDKGQSDAINQGIKMCDGDIIAWINSDDTYLPNTFDIVSNYFKNNQSCEILYGNFYFTDPVGKIMRKVKIGKNISYNKMLFHNYLGQPAVFFTKNGVNNIGMLDQDYHYVMDWEYWLRWMKKYKLHYCNNYFSTYRLQEDAKTSQQGDDKFGNEIRLMISRNQQQIFKSDTLNNLYYKIYSFYSKFQRLYFLISRDPVGSIKIFNWLYSLKNILKYLKWRFKF